MDIQQNQNYSRGSEQYNQYQKRDMTKEELPEQFRPLSMWAYFGYSILYNIPIVGFICVLIFSFGGTQNINHPNFSRSYLCGLIIAFVLMAIIMATIISSGLLSSLSNYYSYS